MRGGVRTSLLVSLSSVLFLAAAASPKSLEIRFATGIFHPGSRSSSSPAWYADSSEKLSPKGHRYLLAVASAALDPEQLRLLEATGAKVLGYLPVHGYLVRIAPPHLDALRALPFLAWVGEAPAHFKVSAELADSAVRGGASVRLRALVQAGEPPHRVEQVLNKLDVVAAPSGKEGAWRLEATVPAHRLAWILSRLAGLPEVEAVETVRPFRALNQDAVWVHQSFVGPSPQQTPIFDHGIFGCGQTIGLADTGQDYDDCFFRDAVNGAPPISPCAFAPCPTGTPALNRRKDILYYNWSGTPTGDDDTCPTFLGGGSGHGTHTSGSAAGDQSPYADCVGFTTPNRSAGDGQAPGAKLVIQEMGDGLEYLNNRGGTLWNLADVAYRSGVRIHSDSWGGACYDIFGSCMEGCTIPYDSFARDADLAMWTYPDLLLVTSSGNGGEFCDPPVSVGTPANAKSLVTVGSLGHGSAATSPSSFSSPGPVFDGRMKPTVAAQGESVVSAGSDASPTSNNCDTCSLDGTSMSAPTTGGLAALVREYYTAGYYATGARNPGSGITPTGALLKATLIDGAVALGPSSPAPDFLSGYGRILLSSTLAFTGGPFQLRVDDYRTGVTSGSVILHAYDVAAGEPLRVTLVWSDYPAALNAATARVNELKLEVIDPTGTVWFQTLDGGGAPQQTSSVAATHDSINVEERLVFNNPAPGRWVVRVKGVDVPMGPQPFALVVRGALAECPAPVSPGAPTLSTPAEHQVQVSWSGVPGAAAYNLYRSLGICPGGAWVQIAAGISGTSFLDSTVSGGVAYGYRVAAGSDAAAFCESAPSPCAEVVPTGDCFLLPSFAGIASATSAGTSTCAVNLSWPAAAAPCSAGVRYNVYRSTSPSFTPGPSNRIARCVGATSYTDSLALAPSTNVYYIVRAEDATTGHGGPCRGGHEESNLVQAATIPAGPPAPGTFIDDGGDTGVASFAANSPWVLAPTGGNAGPKGYRGDSSQLICADLVSPTLMLSAPATGPQLSFAAKSTLQFEEFGYLGDSEGSVGEVEIATGPGFNSWTRVPLTPDYPTLVGLTATSCDTILDNRRYFSDSHPYATYTASLANWAGGDVRIRFRLSGDYFYPSGSWWVDDIHVTQTLVPGACTTLPPGPPPIPDGASVPGQPLQVTASGGNLALSWDATQCPPTAVNVYWGNLGNFASFAGGFCGLASSGSTTLSLPNNVWFLVAGTNGSNTDGSWSRDAAGNEKSYTGASAACPAITQHITNYNCP